VRASRLANRFSRSSLVSNVPSFLIKKPYGRGRALFVVADFLERVAALAGALLLLFVFFREVFIRY
jgi:hypothetical protein